MGIIFKRVHGNGVSSSLPLFFSSFFILLPFTIPFVEAYEVQTAPTPKKEREKKGKGKDGSGSGSGSGSGTGLRLLNMYPWIFFKFFVLWGLWFFFKPASHYCSYSLSISLSDSFSLRVCVCVCGAQLKPIKQTGELEKRVYSTSVLSAFKPGRGGRNLQKAMRLMIVHND